MNKQLCFGVIVIITLGITSTAFMPNFSTQFAVGLTEPGNFMRKAPPAISEDNVYVTWWSNKSGNDEVLFRASNDGGNTFGEKINLSNTTDADSTRAEIDAEADNVVVTWWETNQTDDTPVMRISKDNGKTFGPLLELGMNGTLGTGEAKAIL